MLSKSLMRRVATHEGRILASVTTRGFHASPSPLSSQPPARHQDMLSPEIRAKISKQGRGKVVETPLSAEDAKNPIKSLWSKITDRVQVGKEFVSYLPATEAHPHPSGLKYRDPSPGSQATASVPSSAPELDYDISFYNRKQKELSGYSPGDVVFDYDPNGVPRHVDRPAWVEDKESLSFMRDHFLESGLPLFGHNKRDDKDFAYISAEVYHKQDYGNGLFDEWELDQKREAAVKAKHDEMRYEKWEEWVYSKEGNERREAMIKKQQDDRDHDELMMGASLLRRICQRCKNPAKKKEMVALLSSLSEMELRTSCAQWGLSQEGEKDSLVERLMDTLPKKALENDWQKPKNEVKVKELIQTKYLSKVLDFFYAEAEVYERQKRKELEKDPEYQQLLAQLKRAREDSTQQQES